MREEKSLKKSDIIRILKEEYGRESDPRTVNSSVLSLIELGYPIVTNISKKYGTRSEWYLKKTLSDEEVSAVLLGLRTSEYISPEEKEALSDKIKDFFLTSACGERIIASQCCKSSIDNTFSLLVAIYKAIKDSNMLSFSVINYKTETRKHFEEQGRRIVQYLLKPINVVEGGGRLYLFGELADTGIYRFFPIEKLYDLKQTNVPFDKKNVRTPIPRNNIEGFSMRFDERETATLLIDTIILPDVTDAFGELCRIKCSYGEKSEVEITANFKLLKSYVMGLGISAEVLSPPKLKRSIALELKAVSSKYAEVKRLRGHL